MTQKLLQIILMGQPEMRLDSNRAPADRGRGAQENFFTVDAMRRIYEFSSGIPRVINVLADRAMLAAYAKNTFVIDPVLVECAEADLQGRSE